MKPFNLKEALEGKPVVTRDGREVTQLQKFDCGTINLAGVIDDYVHTWFEDGVYLRKCENRDDLFMREEEVTLWVNVYKNSQSNYFPALLLYNLKEEAEMESDRYPGYVGTYSITVKD